MYLFYGNWLCGGFDNFTSAWSKHSPAALSTIHYPHPVWKKKPLCLSGIIVSKYKPESEHSGCCAAWLSHPSSPHPHAPPHCLRQRQILRSWLWYTSALFVSGVPAWSAAEINLESWWLDGGMCVCYGSSSVCHGDSYTTLFLQNLFRCAAWFMPKYRQTSWSASREVLPAMFWDWVPNLKVLLLSRKIIFTRGRACFVCFS